MVVAVVVVVTVALDDHIEKYIHLLEVQMFVALKIVEKYDSFDQLEVEFVQVELDALLIVNMEMVAFEVEKFDAEIKKKIEIKLKTEITETMSKIDVLDA